MLDDMDSAELSEWKELWGQRRQEQAMEQMKQRTKAKVSAKKKAT
jgi:hypothetical protein